MNGLAPHGDRSYYFGMPTDLRAQLQSALGDSYRL